MTESDKTQLIDAIDAYERLATQLINKLIEETKQPEIEDLKNGLFYQIEDADTINGSRYLSGGWDYCVHGEHCLFTNIKTHQKIEVALGQHEHIKNIDPYFFYDFLKTTKPYCHLTKLFSQPFQDVLSFFELMTEEGKMEHVYGVNFRKSSLQ